MKQKKGGKVLEKNRDEDVGKMVFVDDAPKNSFSVETSEKIGL